MVSGIWAKLGTGAGMRATALVATGGLVAGAGIWWAVSGGPKLQVVQRSSQVIVAAGAEGSAVAGCAKHETALSGGYAIDGGGYATTSEFVGSSAWLVAGYNPGTTDVTMTTYVLCVNAAVEFAPRGEYRDPAHAFHDRNDKVGSEDEVQDLTAQGPFAGKATKFVGKPYCEGGGYSMLGAEFRASRTVSGRSVAPTPLQQLGPAYSKAGEGPVPDGAADVFTYWQANLNNGAELSSKPFPMRGSESVEKKTRLLDPQPPTANYAVATRPICAKLPVTVITRGVDVTAGASADTAVACPKGKFVVGGGFTYQERAESNVIRYYGDGDLYASTDGPTPGPAGTVVKDWRVTGRNQQPAGGIYHDSVWIEHSDAETSTGNGYFDNQPHNSVDQQLRPAAVPASQRLLAEAVCATIDAKPTEPGTAAVVGKPDVPPAIDVPVGGPAPVSASPLPSASASGSPSGLPSPTDSGRPSPSGQPSSSPTGRPTNPNGTPSAHPDPQPQPPTVSIQQPASGGTLRRGCDEHLSATARTQPDGQPITSPNNTAWELIGPNGPVVLGHGSTITVTVPLIKDGSYPLVFSATDPANGLTGKATVQVEIAGCLT